MAAGCGDDDNPPDTQPDAAKSDVRTDTVASDVRTDGADVRVDTPTSDTPVADMAGDTNPPQPDVRVDADATPPQPDVRVDADATPPQPDVRVDADATPPPPPDADASNPPPDADAAPPPPDTPDASLCTADNQCPSNKPHCNTGTGACVSASTLAVTPTNPTNALGTKRQFQATITYSDNSTGPATGATWSSATTTVATIDSAGLASTLTTGTSVITATLGTVSGNTTLTVTGAVITSLAVTPVNPTIALGTTQPFTAIGTFSDTTTQDLTTQVTWTSGTPAVATVDTAGVAHSLTTGSSIITASYGSAPVTGTSTLTVTPATLVSIAVTPATPSIPRFTQQRFTATGTYTDSTTQNLTTQVTWTSSNLVVATISNAVGSQGYATGTGAGTSTITATMPGSVSGTTVLTVTGAFLQSISISPSAPSVANGLVAIFTATGTYSDSTTRDLTTLVTWASSDTTKAVISNTPGSQGVATTVSPGPTDITAEVGGITATTTMTVTAANLVSISITPTNPSIAKGTTQQFTATGTYTDGTTPNITAQVTWGSNNGAVATISNAPGTEGRATGLTPGSASITATLGSINTSTTLTVTNATLVSIAITPSTPSIAKGTDKQFTATGTYTDGSTQNLTAAVAWNSTNNAVASISNALGTEGLAHGADVGSVNITAALGSVSGVTTLTVTTAQLVSIQLTPPTPSIANGTTQAFIATGTYTDNTTEDLTELASWSSSNGAIATVSSAAGTRGVTTGHSVGSATITANYNGVSGSTSITVSLATLVSITVAPVNQTIAAGLTKQYVAFGTYTDGSIQIITTQVVWASSTPAIATISNGVGTEGLATGVAPGETDITATVGTGPSAKVGTTKLFVINATLVSIQVTPTNPTIPVGITQQFVASGTYTDGAVLPLTTQVSWSSSANNRATISNAAGHEGEATAVSVGSTTITATLNGVSGTTTLNVNGATVVSIAVTPTNASVANGTQVQYTAMATFTDASVLNVTTSATWLSSDTSKATISSALGSEGLASTSGVTSSPINISATYGGQTGTTQLSVTNAVLQSITIAPGTASIARGTTQQFVATGHYSDTTTQNITTQVNWGSADSAVANISNGAGTEGLASGVAAGTNVNITASLSGITGSATISVTSATLQSITVLPASGAINPGNTRQYSATGTYSDTTTQVITTLVNWTSSAPGVATISNAAGSNGLATGVAAGMTTITATLAPGTPGTAPLTVNP
jgi:hypothetical protein